ncbi:MAG: hypothetical protein ACXWVD_05600, partial [Telluria sp.]
PIVVPTDLERVAPMFRPTVNAIYEVIRTEARQVRRLAGRSEAASLPTRLPLLSIDLRVQPSSCTRAVTLLAGIAAACIARNLTPVVADRHLRIAHGKHSVRVRVSQRKKQSQTCPGELLIAVDRIGQERRFVDTAVLPLELQLTDVICAIYRGIAETRAWREYFEKHMESAHAESLAREKVAAAAREAQDAMDRLEAEAIRKAEEFEAAAMAWHRSNVLREYATHLETVSSAQVPAGPDCDATAIISK